VQDIETLIFTCAVLLLDMATTSEPMIDGPPLELLQRTLMLVISKGKSDRRAARPQPVHYHLYG